MLRVTTIWTGFAGGPGYTNLYFSDPITPGAGPGSVVAQTHKFFSDMMLCFPSSVRIAVQPVVAAIDPENGQQTDEHVVGTPPGIISGAGTATFAGPSGACVTWRTGAFRNGRRVRGRTFLVPLTTAAYQDDGTIQTTRLQEIQAAAAGLVEAGATEFGQLGVWVRPVGGAGGSFEDVSSYTVGDRVAMLQSRQR